jgi:hypothetical protein
MKTGIVLASPTHLREGVKDVSPHLGAKEITAVKVKHLAAVPALAALVAVSPTAANAAQLSGSTATATASGSPIIVNSVNGWELWTSQTREVWTSTKFKMTARGSVWLDLRTKEYTNASVGVKIIKCSSYASLGGWQKLKKSRTYYRMTGTLKKGTCFRVRAGRSWAGHIGGTVAH